MMQYWYSPFQVRNKAGFDVLNCPNKNKTHKPVLELGTVPEGGLGDAGGKEISQLVRVQSSHATVMNFARYGIRTQNPDLFTTFAG